MDSSKVDMFMMTYGSYFPPESIPTLQDKLRAMDDSKMTMLQMQNFKNPTTILIVSLFLGGWGVDRFMIGQTGAGVGKLLTCGGLGIWTIIDWFTISGLTRKANFMKFMMVAG
ncbi:MAG TPA: TM2 domain-containing protein [Spirochaetota bacterium]|nr:TM2 domain-containing protein [Spirochaetota bacterium]